MKAIHKKDSRTDKENYRLVSILPNISNHMEDVCSANETIILIGFSLSFDVGLEKNLV